MSAIDSSSAATTATTTTTTLRTPVILGSSSKWRAKIMREMGINVERNMNPDIDEYAVTVGGSSAPRHLSDPSALCMAVASAKSSHLLAQLPRSGSPSLLVTSDQVAYFSGFGIREKPADAAQCREWFTQYTSSEPIRVVTAIVVTNTVSMERYAGVVHASQLFMPVPPEVLDGVIARGEILGCCGGFMVDDPDLLPFLSTREGTEDEIIGLPKKLLLQLLQQAQDDIQRTNESSQSSSSNINSGSAQAN